MKTALVLGAGGFIGSHMVKRLKTEGYWVRGVDLKECEYSESEADEFVYQDLRSKEVVSRSMQFKGKTGNYYNHVPREMIKTFDEIYQFARNHGENEAEVIHNSVQINLNLVYWATTEKIFYPMVNNTQDKEYYAAIFSKVLFNAYAKNKNIDINEISK